MQYLKLFIMCVCCLCELHKQQTHIINTFKSNHHIAKIGVQQKLVLEPIIITCSINDISQVASNPGRN